MQLRRRTKLLFDGRLVGSRFYCCVYCRNIVALHDDIVVKNFTSGTGRAFLFSHAMNILEGPKQVRWLITDIHMVADIYCSNCREVLGWKYEQAYRQENKFKDGKFVLDKFKITKAVESPLHL
ncbi:hypothetical protein HYC85_016425 [Camellia sinensis]|uniref:Protein yippee-like n=1 Tax=Camellia sinensis TaxID=4442 RepID=A0A7J7H0T2_CAMSI|nr:hypothetical protein HYC85_016425 [Camellia sinensis]